ncbi:hypothetical protein CMV_017337 [Castanea mollissima]|uniref:Uncharacterized protein n=1 Tax=Castanea mollissima TaxID=60419 RepID=A0A8J4VQP3_9ROSI|nr:hypothetical protein CMV_017337 [Castanea mollissima]
MESLSSKQFYAASLFIVLAICSYMNSSLAATPNQLSSEFFATTVAFPNSPTTHDSQINEKAFATDIITTSAPVPNSATTHDTRINEKASMAGAFPLLCRELLKGYNTQPSAPNPDTYISSSINILADHNAAPAPSPEFPSLRRKLLKGYTRPSAPSPDTYIPASASTLANHKTAPAPSSN